MAPEFQLIGHLEHLAEYGVEYLIVGGVAGRIQGAATTTQDLDIMPDPAPANLERLARALSALDLERRYEVGGREIVASLDDVIASKEAADRAKDRRAMDALYAARDRLLDRPDEYELSEQDLDMDTTDTDD